MPLKCWHIPGESFGVPFRKWWLIYLTARNQEKKLSTSPAQIIQVQARFQLARLNFLSSFNVWNLCYLGLLTRWWRTTVATWTVQVVRCTFSDMVNVLKDEKSEVSQVQQDIEVIDGESRKPPTCEGPRGPAWGPDLALIERVSQQELHGPQVSRLRLRKIKSSNVFLMHYQVYCVT